MRNWLAMGAAGLLAGCNMVVSETPWFTTADEAGAPGLRDGLWAAPSPGCAFTKDAPADQWPGCAHGIVIKGRVARVLPDADNHAPATYVLAAGEPVIWQIHVPPDGGAKPSASGPQYLYVVVVPTARDANGKVTAFQDWPVICGPSPKDEGANSSVADANLWRSTETPFAGLTMIEGGDCTAGSRKALINAARLSRDLTPPPQAMYWVRDGEK